MIQSSSLVVSNTSSLLSEPSTVHCAADQAPANVHVPRLPELPRQHGKAECDECRSDVLKVPRRRTVEMAVQRLLAVHLQRVDTPGGVLNCEFSMLLQSSSQVGGSLTMKFAGSFKRSEHSPGQPDVAYELPAQSPQKVMSDEGSVRQR